MTARIRDALRSLTPTQAMIVGALFIGSAIIAALALWGFTRWNASNR